jgi:hypothetical protein
MIASVKQGTKKLFVRVALHEGAHLHVDVAKSSFFETGSLPKPTHSWGTMQKVWERFLNQKIKLRGVGVYSLPFTNLPESGLIRSMSIESRSGDMGIKLTAGTISLSGAPVQRLKWSLIKSKANKVEVELESRKERVLSELYLLETLETIDNAFGLFVMGHENIAR